MTLTRMLFLLPFVAVVLVGALAIWALLAPRNLQAPPSQLIGRQAPQILSAPLLDSEETQWPAGKPYLVNFFASYCVPCIYEHNQLKALAGLDGVEIMGITFNDRPDAAKAFLERLGNPFLNVYHDAEHADAIAWGVNAIPTTFVVGAQGKILYRHDGAINQPDLPKVMHIVRNAFQ